MNDRYSVAKNPNDDLWYAIGWLYDSYWMPVSNGMRTKAEAERYAKSQPRVDAAARRELRLGDTF